MIILKSNAQTHTNMPDIGEVVLHMAYRGVDVEATAKCDFPFI